MAMISSEDLRLALTALALHRFDSVSKTHNSLARTIFGELKTRRVKECAEGNEPLTGAEHDVMPFLRVMAISGDALYARELTVDYWDSSLSKVRTAPWRRVLQGLMVEGKVKEVEETVEMMQKRGVPFDSMVHQSIILHLAGRCKDMEMTKRWYNHPIANDASPTARSDRLVLNLCIQKNEMEWGESVFKSLVARNNASKVAWDTIFQWSAAKGTSVDEIERMMQIMVRRTEGEEFPLRPDTETINGLIELANTKGDPYTAERYVALGEKLGLQANAQTYLLQLDYRIKAGDLGGARTAYARLQGEEITDDEDLPLTNKLIVALCAENPPDYDAIMDVAEDLSERKVRFEPATVAALSTLHLERHEFDDLTDLLNTHAFQYGHSQRALISNTLLTHILTPKTPTSSAWATYNILRQTFADIPLATRTKLMNSFFTRSRPDMAIHIFGHMRQQPIRSLRPTTSTYATCLSGLARAHDSEGLATIHSMINLDSDIEPDTHLRNALMLAHTGCGDPLPALRIWTEDILHSHEGPSYASIQIALRACESCGDEYGEQVARDIWARLTKMEILLTREIYAAYVGALAGSGRGTLFKECASLVEGMEREVGRKIDALVVGTWYNATKGEAGRRKVKEWVRERHPDVYEQLVRCGMVISKRMIRDDGAVVEEREFNVGRDVDLEKDGDPPDPGA